MYKFKICSECRGVGRLCGSIDNAGPYIPCGECGGSGQLYRKYNRSIRYSIGGDDSVVFINVNYHGPVALKADISVYEWSAELETKMISLGIPLQNMTLRNGYVKVSGVPVPIARQFAQYLLDTGHELNMVRNPSH